MEKHLSFDDYDASVWAQFNRLFDKMNGFSVWGGCDKRENIDYAPSMMSWEVKTEKAQAFFEYAQVMLEQMGIYFTIDYPRR